MDLTYDVSCMSREESSSAKLKLETFKFGKGLPSALSQNKAKQNHGRTHSRSHSRNSSVSSSISILPAQTYNPQGDAPASPSTQKRNSHHRRRSSVSTRRESADLMGVSLPDLPHSSSENNVNFGDKDSIRRRALMALEGKPDVSFTRVEIPELSTPEIERKMFDFPTKPSFPPGSGFSSSLGSGKRDSFKLLASSSSSKDQLQTLVEEEEEDDVEPSSTVEEIKSSPAKIQTFTLPAVAVTKATPPRFRPKTLNLRPLSLTPESLVQAENGLPTPTRTPISLSGLRSLSLTASPHVQSFLGSSDNNLSSSQASTIAQRRTSLSLTPIPLSSRHHPSLECVSSPEDDNRKSLSYRILRNGLPTPEMTPDADRRYSNNCSSDDESTPSRPLSSAEQHFLFKQHNALLARITDLERALSSRSSPRSASVDSDCSSITANEPTDEMLQLVADLKSERDDLKRDADGWRTRVEDLNKQISILGKRVEAERRDAWVARSRLGLLEVEKTAMEKALLEKASLVEEGLTRCDALENERTRLVNTIKSLETQNLVALASMEEECEDLRADLLSERAKREGLESALEKATQLATPTSRPFEFQPSPNRGQGFTSMSSDSSLTDVESTNEPITPLKVVTEEEEDYSEEEDGLAGYEDENESDASFESPGGSSIGSADEFPRSTPTPLASALSEIAAVANKQTHASKSSLSRTWTFPRNVLVGPELSQAKEEVDSFFGCLSSAESSSLEEAFTYEGSKSMFSRGFGAGTDDSELPFLIPSDVGVEASNSLQLSVVLEEDEEEKDEDGAGSAMFGQDFGGITITFTPPESESVLEPSSVSVAPVNPFETPEDEEESTETVTPVVTYPLESKTSSKVPASPSGIPRAPFRSVSGNNGFSTPPRMQKPASAFVTPPTKRGGAMPSFIPQPVSSPLRNSPQLKLAHTFSRQPQRKPAPLLPSLNRVSSGVKDGSAFKTQSTTNPFSMNSLFRFADLSSAENSSSSEIGEGATPIESVQPAVENQQNRFFSPTYSFMPRFSTITNFIPLPWAPNSSGQSEAVSNDLYDEPSSSTNGFRDDPPIVIARERCFVPRERQLERLKRRMAEERLGYASSDSRAISNTIVNI